MSVFCSASSRFAYSSIMKYLSFEIETKRKIYIHLLFTMKWHMCIPVALSQSRFMRRYSLFVWFACLSNAFHYCRCMIERIWHVQFVLKLMNSPQYWLCDILFKRTRNKLKSIRNAVYADVDYQIDFFFFAHGDNMRYECYSGWKHLTGAYILVLKSLWKHIFNATLAEDGTKRKKSTMPNAT